MCTQLKNLINYQLLTSIKVICSWDKRVCIDDVTRLYLPTTSFTYQIKIPIHFKLACNLPYLWLIMPRSISSLGTKWYSLDSSSWCFLRLLVSINSNILLFLVYIYNVDSSFICLHLFFTHLTILAFCVCGANKPKHISPCTFIHHYTHTY